MTIKKDLKGKCGMNLFEELQQEKDYEEGLGYWLERADNFINRYSKEPTKKSKDFVRDWHEKHGESFKPVCRDRW